MRIYTRVEVSADSTLCFPVPEENPVAAGAGTDPSGRGGRNMLLFRRSFLCLRERICRPVSW